MTQVQLYDTTLRDGAQKEGISFSVVDKLQIVQKLDELGIHYIEGGWPGSNPKDAAFFSKAQELPLKNSVIVAFGSTRRPNSRVKTDANIQALLEAGVSTVAVVGKNSIRQVTDVLETTPEENLKMIGDSIRYLTEQGLNVFYDAEHFFDGFKLDRDYALQCLATAAKSGASYFVLCDTNGGALPEEIAEGVSAACGVSGVPVAIHAHNDAGLAVANTLAAVKAGATQVQGTINGYGERCGNANLCTIIPNLKLKLGIECVTDEQLLQLTEVSRYVSLTANLPLDPSLPYIGSSAFSHKGGIHVSGMAKWDGSYQHINPELVGNRTRVVVSELSGRRNIINKAQDFGVELSGESPEVKQLLEQVKQMESKGFQYENAEASLELLMRRGQKDYKPPFELVDFMAVIEKRRRAPTRRSAEEMLSEAMVKVKVENELMHTVAEGNGPVNALDQALRKALLQFYPGIAIVKLVDFKVRILEENTGTESQVRVIIRSTDGNEEWYTVGGSPNIIEASWLALADSMEYWLMKHAQ